MTKQAIGILSYHNLDVLYGFPCKQFSTIFGLLLIEYTKLFVFYRLSANTSLDPIQGGNTNVANITVSRDKYSEVHQNLTKSTASEPLENSIETVISPNTDAPCSNLLIKEKHFIHSNKLNQPMIKENSLSLPD